MRGTGATSEPVGCLCRFIPACAGNGCHHKCSDRYPPVHPRVCGERNNRWTKVNPRTGSSPRVRGTGPGRAERLCVRRFIPACAGNGHVRLPGGALMPVHPRVCGERRRALAYPRISAGSSPRVRGTDADQTPASTQLRFIPACAGNGPGRQRARLWPPASSPRVRGTAIWRQSLRHLTRFIPACAGNGVAEQLIAAGVTVHPRVCGERAQKVDPGSPRIGSSPRVRGTDPDATRVDVEHRFIPACAGNGDQNAC